jgi:hypothetical protein
MKKKIPQSLSYLFWCLVMWLAITSNSWAQTTTFTYQGSLTTGGNLANGSYDLQFKLYDQLMVGVLQGSPNTVTVSNVMVNGGVFTVELDFGAAAWPGAARYLEIAVRVAGSGSFTTLTPRQQLTSTPYSIRSLSATTATSATNFSGTLAGDVTGTQGATVVSLVGGLSASNIANGVTAANNATNSNTANTIVKRDASGNFAAGTITATNFSGSGASLTNLNANNINSGTLLDSLLPSNVARLNTAQTFTANQTINANLIQSGTLVQFTLTNGLVAGGTEGSGSIPATGAGVRMMWYPRKAAFRAGKVTGAGSAYWDDANVGIGSTAFGENTRASGLNSFAAGESANASGRGSVAFSLGVASGIYSFAHYGTANGTNAIALGNSTLASGDGAVALGDGARATNSTSVALGSCTASGDGATCLGSSSATGDWSTTIGHWVSSSSNSSNTTTYRGVIAFGDFSGGVGNTLYATANNQFNARAAGGYRFFASSDTSDTTKPGLFISGTTGNTQINGNLTVSGTISGTFSGSLAGDVTGTQSATVVSTVGGVTASNVASGATAANNATSSNTANTIIKRDASGHFAAGTITATNFSGSGANLTNLNANNISSGTLLDSVLSSNVALENTANTFTANQTINANLIQSGTLVQFTPTDGLVVGGTLGSGSIPAMGAGTRMMWYPGKAAFRVGRVNGTAWDAPGNWSFAAGWDNNASGQGSAAFGSTNTASGANSFTSGAVNSVSGANSVAMGWNNFVSGDRSVALGYQNEASGEYSTALGFSNEAIGTASVALGWDNIASGNISFAAGSTNEASGLWSVALGNGVVSSGQASVAMGSSTIASGPFSTALGRNASTNGKDGSFVYGDDSTDVDEIKATVDNQFVVRAQNVWFGTNSSATATSGRFLETSTGAYLTTGGTWTNSSSRALKTNFAPVNARAVLQQVLRLPIQTWNYKAEDGKARHIGAVSQDFHQLFGYGDSAESIATVDADGVALAAIQGLHEELKDRDTKLAQQQQELGQLKQQVKQQQAVIDGLRQLLCAQQPQAELCKIR